MNRILIVGLFGTAAVAAAGIGYLRSIDFDRFRPALVAELRAATGRDVAIDGPLRLALLPVPHFTMSSVAVANAPWGTRPVLAQVQRVDANIALGPLLKGKLRISRLKLVRPDLWLETDPYGKVNWVLAGEDGARLMNAGQLQSQDGHEPAGRTAGALLSALAIGRVDMAGGRVTYRDGATGDITVVGVSSASVEGDGHRTPLKLAFAGDWNALPLTLNGVVGPFNAIAFDEGRASAVRFALDTAGVRLSVGGTVGNPRSGPGATLHISGSAAALDKLGSLLGLALPQAAAASFDADLRYRKALLELNDVRLALGGQSAHGALKVNFAQPRPVFTAELHAADINLSELASGPSAAAEPALIQALADSGLLTLVDGKADLTADTLAAGPVALRDAEAHLTVKDSALVVSPLRGQSAGGPIEASFRIDGRSVPARLSLSVKAPTLAIGPVLQRLDTIEAFGGVVSFAANLTTVAGPPEKMLAGLQGEALLAMGEGRLTLEPYRTPFAVSPAGLGGLAGLLAAQGRRDVGIECVAGRVTVDGGVARSDGLVLVSEDARIKGVGSVDLRDGRVALRFTPEARNGALLVGRPVALRGALGAPMLTEEPAAAHRASMSDVALYPLRRFFAGLGAGSGANACLRSLPPVPHRRTRLRGEPIAQRPQTSVQEAGIPAGQSLSAPVASSPVE
jgi:AsmA family protein